VITDHNCLQGALEAKGIEPDFVVIGEEIKTTYGEFLVAFIKEEIPANLDPFKVLELLHSQDAFISVSHPFDEFRSGWPLALLKEIAPDEQKFYDKGAKEVEKEIKKKYKFTKILKIVEGGKERQDLAEDQPTHHRDTQGMA